MPGTAPSASDSVAVLVSGGVDSALALALAVEHGGPVTAITLCLPVYRTLQDLQSDPASLPDSGHLQDAEAVCRRLRVPLVVLDARNEFAEQVVYPFLEAYRRGQTPNPCVLCNSAIKFGLAWNHACRLGAAAVWTGHYAALAVRDGVPRLGRARDPLRDQSYFLYRLGEDARRRVAFPLGDFPDKAAVRAEAARRGLPASDREDSMDACFLPEGDYRILFGPERPGNFEDADGNILGRHRGAERYTVGQRKGLGQSFGPNRSYVTRIDAERNVVVLGSRADAETNVVAAARPVCHIPVAEGMRLWGKIRSGGDARPCVVTRADGETLAARFDEAAFAPTAGQHLVLYDADGWIVAGGEIL